jgi:DNA-binding MarR family transcriptional regulator
MVVSAQPPGPAKYHTRLMPSDTVHDPGSVLPEVDRAEAGLTVLIEAWQQAVEELGGVLPPGQLRALLIVETVGRVNLTGLARELGASPSATSKLCDRMAAAGLLNRETAAASRREITLRLTESGQRLANWVRDQHRAGLARTLASMSPEGRADLLRGLTELAGRG